MILIQGHDAACQVCAVLSVAPVDRERRNLIRRAVLEVVGDDRVQLRVISASLADLTTADLARATPHHEEVGRQEDDQDDKEDTADCQHHIDCLLTLV